MRYCFIASDIHGGGHLRSIWPAEVLKQNGWDVWWSTSFINAAPADVVISHRPLDPWAQRSLAALKKDGKIIIVDEDDDLSAIPQRFHQGRYDHEKNDALIKNHDECLVMADGAIFSTDHIARRYGKLQPNHIVMKNYLPAWVNAVEFYKGRDQQPLRVGWAGIVDTHEADLQWIRPYADTLFAGVEFTNVGDMQVPGVIGAHASEAFPFTSDLNDFYRLMAHADIGMVPLDTVGSARGLNLGKSWLKALEYCALGKPVVVTDLPEQAALISLTGHGLVASSPQDFAEGVQRLVHDHALRSELGRNAREARGGLAIENHWKEWAAAITQIVEAATIRRGKRASVGSTVGSTPSPSLIAATR